MRDVHGKCYYGSRNNQSIYLQAKNIVSTRNSSLIHCNNNIIVLTFYILIIHVF